MAPLEMDNTSSNRSNYAENIDIDLDGSGGELSVEMSSGEDSTVEKQPRKNSKPRSGRTSTASRRRRAPQRMKSRSLSPEDKKRLPSLSRSRSRSLSPDTTRKRTVEFEKMATRKAPPTRRALKNTGGSRRKLLGDVCKASSMRRLEKSPSRRKLIDDLNDSSNRSDSCSEKPYRRKSLSKTPSTRRLKENSISSTETTRRGLTEKPPSRRNLLRKTNSMKMTRSSSTRRLNDNSSNDNNRLQKGSSRRNLSAESGKKTSTRRLKETLDATTSKVSKQSSRRNLVANESTRKPRKGRIRTKERSHSVDSPTRMTKKALPEPAKSRSLSPEQRNRRRQRKQTARRAEPGRGSQLKETVTKFECTTDIKVGRKRHQDRRKKDAANLTTMVQKHNDSLQNWEFDPNKESSEEEEKQSAEVQPSIEGEQGEEKNKSSEWKKAKKKLTKMTKKIIGKQAEMLFFSGQQDGYGAVRGGEEPYLQGDSNQNPVVA